MFHQLQRNVISKHDAEKRMVSVSVDGAAVNMGQHAGLKALIQKERDDLGTNPGLDCWGWSWVIVRATLC